MLTFPPSLGPAATSRPYRGRHAGDGSFAARHPQGRIVKNILRHLALLAAGAFLASIIALILLDAIIMPYLVDTPSVQVPNLQGLFASEASTRLEEAGPEGDYRRFATPRNRSADAVVDQDPSGGQLVKQGRRIVLTVSKGARYYEVPDVRRVSMREARLQLEENQLKIGQILYRSSDTLPEGAVVRAVASPRCSARSRQCG